MASPQGKISSKYWSNQDPTHNELLICMETSILSLVSIILIIIYKILCNVEVESHGADCSTEFFTGLGQFLEGCHCFVDGTAHEVRRRLILI